MKKFSIVICCLLTAVSVAAQKGKTPVKPVPKTVVKVSLDSFSYAIGVNIATNMQQQGIGLAQLNFASMQKGMDAVFKSLPRLMDENQCNTTIQQKMQEFMGKKSEAEKTKGTTFLTANAKRKGITVLPNGLQYEITKAAPDSNILMPKPEDTVVVNYAGTLIDGQEFDNSFKRGQPAVFPVGGVIPGWTQILQMMRVGDKWRVYIPAELAYNMNPPTPSIPAGAVLIFDISLEGIKKAAPNPLH